MPSFTDLMNDSGDDCTSASFSVSHIPTSASSDAALSNPAMFLGTHPTMPIRMGHVDKAEPQIVNTGTSFMSAPVVRSQANHATMSLPSYKYAPEANGMIPALPMGAPMRMPSALYSSPASSCSSSMALTPDTDVLRTGILPPSIGSFPLQAGHGAADYMPFSSDALLEGRMLYDMPFYSMMTGTSVPPPMVTPMFTPKPVMFQHETLRHQSMVTQFRDKEWAEPPIAAPSDQRNSDPQSQPNESQRVKTKVGRRPRRHTVSTPYHNSVRGKELSAANHPPMPTTELSVTDKQKLLRTKRHRSLGKLEIDSSAWIPETATVSSASSTCSPAEADGDKMGFGDQEMRTPLIADDDLPAEDCKTQCLWADCRLDLPTLNDLINHVKDIHIGSGKPFYNCEWKDCTRNKKPFTKRHKMHNHLRTHTGERPFECLEPGCGRRFSRPDSLTTHMKIHSNIRPHLCQYENCQKAYYHLRSLRKHERTHEQHFFPSDEAQILHQRSTNVAHATPTSDFGMASGEHTMADWAGVHI